MEGRRTWTTCSEGDHMGNREKELEKQGWKKQFIADEPRLSESVELYKELGFEVHLEPLDLNEMPGECNKCMAESPEKYKIIFTRKNEK
jgi:hypothetical protein